MGGFRRDLTGQTFGNLLVIKEDKIIKHKKYWLCECQCSNKTIKSVETSHLKNGHTKSCGCLPRPNKLNEIIGKQFGKLIVLRKDETKDNINFVICQCNCKNKTIKSIRIKDLKSGKTKSCGCLVKKYNTYDLSNKYGIGYTTNNNEFYFDLEDYEKIKNYCWFFDKKGYVVTKKDEKTIRLQRYLFNIEEFLIKVDHINHNLKDNRKCNLRIVNDSKNNMNKKLAKNNTSGVKGVNWHNRDSIWESSITYNKQRIYLGRFRNFKDAVRIRKEAEEKYQREYAYDKSIIRNQDIKMENTYL